MPYGKDMTDSNSSIQQVNDFFPADIAEQIANYANFHAQYRYGETDANDKPPSGLISDLFYLIDNRNNITGENEKLIYNYFTEYLNKKYIGVLDTYQIYRLYINSFAPREPAYFHTDAPKEADELTFIYYPLHCFDYNINQGGCTEFFLEEKIIGFLPYYNSIIKFDSHIEHRATAFKDQRRFTIAIKCINKDEIKNLMSNHSKILQN